MATSVERMTVYGGVLLFIMAIFAAVGAILWPYTINTWLIFFGKPATIKAWHGALLGFTPVIGQIMIPAAFITWVLMLFIS